MALDKPKDQDDTHKVGDLTFLTEKGFMEKMKPIKVDFSTMGFSINAGIDFGSAAECGTCSSSSGTCGT